MPTLFTARFGESPEFVRYFHFRIGPFYLGAARDYARHATQLEDPELVLRAVVAAIAFSAMAVEALINEAADEVVPSDQLDAFDRCQKPFRRSKGMAELEFKYRTLVERFKEATVPPDILSCLRELADLRNTLVHYKPMKTAGRAIMPPPPRGGSRGTIVIDFLAPPDRLVPPFVQRLTPTAALASYNTAVQAIRFWYGFGGRDWDYDVFPDL